MILKTNKRKTESGKRKAKFSIFNFQLSIIIMTVLACNRADIDPTPAIPQQAGDVLSIGIKSAGLPSVGYYGLFGIEYAYDETPSWTPFYINNIEATIINNKLDLGSAVCRYPINDYLAVFLYYPHSATSTPNSISVERTVDVNSDKYPDYLGGTKHISVVGGAPKNASDASVELSHLMSRVRFQARNLGADEIVLTSVKLVGITWKGIINPQINTVAGYYTPDGGTLAETVTLINNFTLNDAVETARPIQIYPKYNYSDIEAAEGDTYNNKLKYYMLVPPLSETPLIAANLIIEYVRYNVTYSRTIQLRQGNINEWKPGASYCYTINFDAFTIDNIDVQIEPWLEELFIGNINIEDLP